MFFVWANPKESYATVIYYHPRYNETWVFAGLLSITIIMGLYWIIKAKWPTLAERHKSKFIVLVVAGPVLLLYPLLLRVRGGFSDVAVLLGSLVFLFLLWISLKFARKHVRMPLLLGVITISSLSNFHLLLETPQFGMHFALFMVISIIALAIIIVQWSAEKLLPYVQGVYAANKKRINIGLSLIAALFFANCTLLLMSFWRRVQWAELGWGISAIILNVVAGYIIFRLVQFYRIHREKTALWGSIFLLLQLVIINTLLVTLVQSRYVTQLWIFGFVAVYFFGPYLAYHFIQRLSEQVRNVIFICTFIIFVITTLVFGGILISAG